MYQIYLAIRWEGDLIESGGRVGMGAGRKGVSLPKIPW